MQKRKILFIRFSSIGDIVLTSPVVRCTKEQLRDYEIHFVTKEKFRPLVESNPFIDKIFSFKEHISELYEALARENYEFVIDLHRNFRSLQLRKKLKVRSFVFNKINVRKYIAVNFKYLSVLPYKHIVDRYFDTVKQIGVDNDGKGLDFFIKPEDEIDISARFFSDRKEKFVVLTPGGSYFTKKIPVEKLREICANIQMPVILLGDGNDAMIAELLVKEFPSVINACGVLNIGQSASVVRQAEWVITSDTGLMHIAAAFNRKIISVWGNTIPEFGMSPYLPHPDNLILEVKPLQCRPCSKLGYNQCPLGHFKCMREIDFTFTGSLE